MALIDKLNAIGDAIRAKTGKTDKLTLDQMPLEIESITGGGGSSVVDIIPEQDLTFTFDESSGASVLTGYNLFNLTSMTVGEKYKVVWGEDEYESVATEVSFYGYPMIAIGNPVMVGGENNNLPFAIGYITIPDDGNSQYSCIIASLDGSTSKKVHIYHEASAGVQDDRVKYVTFIGLGGVELYRQPVIVGDTCHNPVDKNYIETPTKESTVQYTYTYSGWSLTEGGSASSSALANVTEDRTVYVAFKEEVRKYTVRFFDGDTLVDTVQTAYGETAVTTYSKVGYSLVAWTPSNENITKDTDCYGEWEEAYKLANMTWAQIASMSKAGNGTKFEIGDTKEIEYEGATRTVTLVGINQDEVGTTTSTTASTFTKNSMTFRFDFLCNYDGVIDTQGRFVTGGTLVNGGSMVAKIPSDLKSVLRVKKVNTYSPSTDGTYSAKSYLFIPSLTELGCSLAYGVKEGYEGERYQLYEYVPYAALEERIMRLTDGTAGIYWTRTVNKNNYKQLIDATGKSFIGADYNDYSTAYYSVYFCV